MSPWARALSSVNRIIVNKKTPGDPVLGQEILGDPVLGQEVLGDPVLGQ